MILIKQTTVQFGVTSERRNYQFPDPQGAMLYMADLELSRDAYVVGLSRRHMVLQVKNGPTVDYTNVDTYIPGELEPLLRLVQAVETSRLLRGVAADDMPSVSIREHHDIAPLSLTPALQERLAGPKWVVAAALYALNIHDDGLIAAAMRGSIKDLRVAMDLAYDYDCELSEVLV